MLNLAVSLIILSICSSIVVYSNMKTVEQICNPYYLQCFCASRGGGGGEEIALQYCIWADKMLLLLSQDLVFQFKKQIVGGRGDPT